MFGSHALWEALRGGAPVPPPTAPLYLSLYLEPRRRKLLAQVYAEMAEGDSTLRLTFDEELEAQVEALGRAAALFSEPPAWLPTGLGPSRDAVHGAKVTFPPGKCLWHSPAGGEPIDYLAFFDNRHHDVWEMEGELPTAEEVAATEQNPGWEEYVERGMCELARRAVERFGDRYLMTAAVGAPYWQCYSRLGFSGMMRALRERPELIEAVVATACRSALPVAQALWQVGVRCMFVEECLSSADLISADDYRRFALPATRDLLAGLKDIGYRVVYYYCGAIEGRVEHLASLPADALAFEESKKGFVIDLGQIRQQVGPDVLLFGNTDVVLLRDGDQAAISAEVARQYAQAGPRYVVSTGSPVTLDTPPEKLDMLCRAAAALAPARQGNAS